MRASGIGGEVGLRAMLCMDVRVHAHDALVSRGSRSYGDGTRPSESCALLLRAWALETQAAGPGGFTVSSLRRLLLCLRVLRVGAPWFGRVGERRVPLLSRGGGVVVQVVVACLLLQ